jgi:hypothetical protein
MWHRVFGLNDIMPQPAQMQACFGWGEIHVRGDDLGWTSLEAGEMRIERYVPDADDIRDELDAWAAWVESRSAESRHTALMQHIISTRQLLTFQSDAAEAGESIARWLAAKTEGIYQVDSRGFFAADGTLLIKDD